MNYRVIISLQLILLFINGLSYGQDFLSTKIPQKEAIEDFDYLRSAIEQGHSALYWYRDSADVAHRFDSLRNVITEDISNTNFHSLLKAALETFSCGHTTVNFPSSYTSMIDSVNKFIPLKVKLIKNDVFIVEDLSEQKIEAGSKLLSINGVQIKQIVEELKIKVPTDKGIYSKQIRSLDFFFSYYLTLYYGINDTYEIQYSSPFTPDTLTTSITALPGDGHVIRSGKEIYNSDFPIEFSLDKNQRIAYLTIKSFEPRYYKEMKINYNDTLASIFKEIKELKTQSLILDLRGNIGGSMVYGENLFSFLIDKPSKYFKNALIKKAVADGNYEYSKTPRLIERFKKMYSITEYQDSYVLTKADSVMPSLNQYTGKLYILANGLSFSSTACFIAQCKDKNNGVLIGEQPGGAYSGLSTSPAMNIALPNTSYNLFMKATLINLAVQETEAHIKVDYEVLPTITDVVNGTDPEMRFALKLISKK
ncbi:MAG: hypothetical protein ACJA08_001764 [Cyclobacteriaceae bacterium]|jgi:hypothetical protein